MKLIKFEASGVHDYLDFNVVFRPDVNFFAGLNGCGKTTALKMIMALLTPSVELLYEIKFSKALLCVQNKSEVLSISCIRNGDSLHFYLHNEHSLVVQGAVSFDEFIQNKHHHISRDFHESSVIREISKLGSPMFLSLDRRFVKSARDDRSYNLIFEHERGTRQSQRSNDESINEVLAIVDGVSRMARAKQVAADKRLRDKIILDSLTFTGGDESTAFMPDNRIAQELRQKQHAIKKTLDNLDLPSEELANKFNELISKVEEVARKVEELRNLEKTDINSHAIEMEFHRAVEEWIVNKDQLNRINRLFVMVEDYQNEKKKIYNNLTTFERLVNKFLIETGKKIVINPMGKIIVKFAGVTKELTVLSSGERQILIMLVHLVLDKNLPKHGVFIIDEPELSLHISWQDKFVEVIQEAGPKLQIILATHSPAIIGGRNEMYVPLNGEF